MEKMDASSSSQSIQIKGKLKELISVLQRKSNIDDNYVDKLFRLARPASNESVFNFAIKQKLRQTLLTNNRSGNDGPLLVANLEKVCDELKQRYKFKYLTQFLAMLEPLAYSFIPKKSYFSHEIGSYSRLCILMQRSPS